MKFPERWNRAAVSEPYPHLWILHNNFGSGGAVYFLLRPGDDLDVGNEILTSTLEHSFQSIDGVYGVRADATFIEVEWSVKDDPTVIRTAYPAINSTGLGLLSQYFGWQGELRVGKFETLREMQAFRMHHDFRDRWRFGSY